MLRACYSTMTVIHDLSLLEEGFPEYTLGTCFPVTDKEAGKKDKSEKKKEKQVADRIKINMANERTFNNWVATGMQIGAIGTMVLLALDPKRSTAWGIITLAFAWTVGFAIAFYGLIGYYGRRRALESGNLSTDPAMWRPFTPALLMTSLVVVVVTSLVYVGLSEASLTTSSS